ncbi:hypothetical protein [Actinomadura roseirufa]|uniref:hypothetical protein n=1 Tax=Actinomadura roseirufa TaxID=2094049 RepID=UPI001040EA6D|nr:hypothetical protein [Actinomadura roseirufa]
MNPPEQPKWATRLEFERKSRGWGKWETARRLLKAKGNTAPTTLQVKTTARMVVHHERGNFYPAAYGTLYAIIYETTREDLFGDESDDQPYKASGRPINGMPGGTVDRNPTPEKEAGDYCGDLLQDALALAAGATVAPALADLPQRGRDEEVRPLGASVSRAMIDDWENAYDVHAASYRYDPPIVVLAALAADWTEIAPHLRRARPDAAGRDLAHAAARHAFLIAGGLTELGERRHSRRWWATSRRLADESRDRDLASQARSWEVTTRLSDDREDPQGLVPLAQEGRRLAGTRPTFSLIYAVAVEAEMYAAAGDLRRALTTIHEVEALFERLPAAGRHWGEDRLRYVQSQIYSWLGDMKRAGEAQDAAHACFRPGDFKTVQLNLHRPILHARTDPEEALGQALAIIDALPQERRIARVQSNARRVLTVLPEKARVLPAARELRALTTSQSRSTAFL